MFFAEVILGFLAGLIGLLPFLHLNFLISFAGPFGVLFVSAFGFASIVFSFVPGVFFGIPSDASGIAVLPSQEMARKGEGLKALRLLVLSFFFGLIASVALLPLFWFLLPIISLAIKPFLGFVLLAVVLVFFLVNGVSFYAFFAFLLSGLLGLAVFNLPLLDSLFPLLAGLFGLPALLFSFDEKDGKPPVVKGGFLEVSLPLVLAGSLLGAFSVLLPALSPSFLASFAFLFLENSPESFLVLTGAIASSKAFFDLVSVFLLGKARSGFAAFFLGKQAGFIDVASAGLFGACAAVLAVLFFGNRLVFSFGEKFKKIIFLLVVLGVFFTSGALGLTVLLAATLVGLVPLVYGIDRANCVGALILPALLFAFGISV